MELREHINMSGFGYASRLSKKLNLPQALISQWANKVRPVPVERCTAIEQATNGAVTRRDLRPDDWHLIWPELAEKVAEEKEVA